MPAAGCRLAVLFGAPWPLLDLGTKTISSDEEEFEGHGEGARMVRARRAGSMPTSASPGQSRGNLALSGCSTSSIIFGGDFSSGAKLSLSKLMLAEVAPEPCERPASNTVSSWPSRGGGSGGGEGDGAGAGDWVSSKSGAVGCNSTYGARVPAATKLIAFLRNGVPQALWKRSVLEASSRMERLCEGVAVCF